MGHLDQQGGLNQVGTGPTFTLSPHHKPMKTLTLIADDKAAAINGGFFNTTSFQQNQTSTSGSGGIFGTSSASSFQAIAVGNTGTALVGIGAFRFF